MVNETRSTTRLSGVTGGEVVVAALALHDVHVVFGIPGTHNLSVFDALTRYGIRTASVSNAMSLPREGVEYPSASWYFATTDVLPPSVRRSSRPPTTVIEAGVRP